MEGETPQLLLQLSVGQPAVEFTQLLVRAGARADMYSDDVGQERHLAHFKLRFRCILSPVENDEFPDLSSIYEPLTFSGSNSHSNSG